MKFKIKALIAAAAVFAFGAVAWAQVSPPKVSAISATDLFQDVPNGNPSAGAVYASALQLRSWILGQNATNGTPTLTTSGSGCGGSTATIVGSNYAFAVTEGSTASTTCVVTFVPAFVTAPVCTAGLNNVTDSSFKIATTATTLTATQSSASSNVLNVICMGQSGG